MVGTWAPIAKLRKRFYVARDVAKPSYNGILSYSSST
jgi:hypothetical protein